MSVIYFIAWLVVTVTVTVLRYVVWPVILFAIFGPLFPIIWLFVH